MGAETLFISFTWRFAIFRAMVRAREAEQDVGQYEGFFDLDLPLRRSAAGAWPVRRRSHAGHLPVNTCLVFREANVSVGE